MPFGRWARRAGRRAGVAAAGAAAACARSRLPCFGRAEVSRHRGRRLRRAAPTNPPVSAMSARRSSTRAPHGHGLDCRHLRGAVPRVVGLHEGRRRGHRHEQAHPGHPRRAAAQDQDRMGGYSQGAAVVDVVATSPVAGLGYSAPLLTCSWSSRASPRSWFSATRRRARPASR